MLYCRESGRKIRSMRLSKSGNNYYIGLTKQLNGLGVMLEIDPPFTMVRKAWCFEVAFLWFKFWYVRERRKPVAIRK